MNDETENKLLITTSMCKQNQHCDYFELMLTISKEILSSLEIKEITHSLYAHLNRVLDAPIFAIGIYNESQECLDFWGVKDQKDALRIGSLALFNDKIWSVSCFLSQEEIIKNSPPQDSEMSFSRLLFSDSDEKRKSFIYLPLTSNKQRIGVLTVQSFEENAYQAMQITFLRSLANYITIALEKAQAFKKIEEQKEEIEFKSIGLEATLNNLEEIVNLRTFELMAQKEELQQQSKYLETLNKELERLSIVARETDNAIMIMNSLGDVLWVNDCFTRTYNYTLEEFISQRGTNIRKTSFCADINTHIDECISQKKAVIYQALNISSDNKQVWSQTSLTPILNSEGEIQHLVAIDSDISKIKEAERQIIDQSNNITQSIRYASNIQRSVLPSIEKFKSIFPEAFIFFKPRDIVSGDFYWYHQQQDCIWVVAADCTGHGVPGALMSILGISLLQEISRQHANSSAGQVLSLLRSYLKKSLQQPNQTTINDGMDAALIIINQKNRTIQYAGAYNSLIMIRNGERHEYHADKMPIGEHIRQTGEFTTHHINYQTNDTLYLFSDGFASQFGGPRCRKFMRKQFYDLLLESSSKPMDKQTECISERLNDWMQTESHQTDDILVMGIKMAKCCNDK